VAEILKWAFKFDRWRLSKFV